METPKASDRNVFDPKLYEFDTVPYTRVPDEFDMQQYINGFTGGSGGSSGGGGNQPGLVSDPVQEKGGKVDWANCKCPVIARLVDAHNAHESHETRGTPGSRGSHEVRGSHGTTTATTTPLLVTPTPAPQTAPPKMPSLPPLPPFRSSVADLEEKIRGITNSDSGQGGEATSDSGGSTN